MNKVGKDVRNKASPSEYLAFLSTKYEVDPDEFFHALVSAEETGKSGCGNLLIECRGKKRDKVIFLILKGSKVVAQFPIFRDFLLQQRNPIRNFTKSGMIRRYLDKKNRKSCSLLIGDLRAGMRHVNLKARVLEIPKPRLVFTRFGNCANVTNALIADETGKIKLCLWNEQINSVSVGNTIQVENARTSTFRGERQLKIGKEGTLSTVKDVDSLPIEMQSH